MHRVVAIAVVVVCPLVIACSGTQVPTYVPPAPSPASRQPRIVAVIVVDQLPSWVFERDRAHFTGGFARLLREGGYVHFGELPYSNAFTAPGHATIGTGATPNVHGIVGNSWWRRDEARERYAEHDPAARMFSVGPSHGGALTDDETASSKALHVGGIADSLRRATNGRGKSVAIGLKPRAASFVIGRPDLAIWYEGAAGGMTTSPGYVPALPVWLAEHARTHPTSRYFTQIWTPLDATLLARVTGITDDAPGEGASDGLGRTFPHDLAASDAPARAFVHTPFADDMVIDTALAAIDALQLGADDVPDVLGLCLNAHDYAGHLWGPQSWEALDLTLRLDRALGKLFDTFDAKFGRRGWAIVLTSDHGATPVVDQSGKGRRIGRAEITNAVEAALEPHVGKGPWVAKLVSSNVYLTPAFARATNHDAALTAAAAALAQLPNVAGAGRNDKVAHDCEKRDGLERLVCRSIVDGESGELYIVPATGSLISDYPTGTHHDAPSADNLRVPIFVRAPGLAPQTGEGTLLQVAPTVTALLGVPPPEAATEPPLFGLR